MHTATKEFMVSIEPMAFRKVMRRLATGVTVVTVRDGSRLHGMTANTFTSVSLAPTLVLISVAQEGVTHDMIRRAGHYTVNVLTAAQRGLAQRFARQVPVPDDPFADIPHHLSISGAPVFDDSVFWVDCRVVAAHTPPATTRYSSVRCWPWIMAGAKTMIHSSTWTDAMPAWIPERRMTERAAVRPNRSPIPSYQMRFPAARPERRQPNGRPRPGLLLAVA